MAKVNSVKIRWKAPADPTDIVGYRLYWELAPNPVDLLSANHDCGMKTEVIVPNEVPTFPLVDQTINIGVTSYDDLGNESDFLEGSRPFDFIAPNAPTDLEFL